AEAGKLGERLGGVVGRHTPLDGGPLARTPAAGSLTVDPRDGANSVMATFRSGTYLEMETRQPTRLYRVFVLDEEASRMARKLADPALGAGERTALREALDKYLTRENGPIRRAYWT